MKTLIEYIQKKHITTQPSFEDILSDGDYFVCEYNENIASRYGYNPAKVMGKLKKIEKNDKPVRFKTYFQINMGTKGVAGVYQHASCAFYPEAEEILREPTDDELNILKDIDKQTSITGDGNKEIIGEFDYNDNTFRRVF